MSDINNANQRAPRPTIKLSKSMPLLNYVAFFILFVTSFVFVFQRNAAILGYALLFITNTVCMIYVIGELLPKLSDINNSYFVPILAVIAVMSSSILHFVSLIFVLMMIYKLHTKYSVTDGVPINIPPPYNLQLYEFNVLMVTTFCLCTVLILIIKFRPEKIDINLYEFIRRMNLIMVLRNSTFLFTFALSVSAIVISGLQVQTADKFAKLSRQQLNVTESNSIKKNKNHDFRFNIDRINGGDTQFLKNTINTSFLINA